MFLDLFSKLEKPFKIFCNFQANISGNMKIQITCCFYKLRNVYQLNNISILRKNINNYMKNIALIYCAILFVNSIFIPISLGQNVCAAILTPSEDMKIQIIFPLLPEQIEGEVFLLTIQSTEDQQQIYDHVAAPGQILRQEIKLNESAVYQVCFELISPRFSLPKNQSVGISYKITEDLEKLIGTIEVPKDLSNQPKLAKIYQLTEEIDKLNKKVIQQQQNQRKVQDTISDNIIHKNYRILKITVIECIVIILSGALQIYLLRKFLIDRNLY